MFQKQDVSFPVEGGIHLSAWLLLPKHRSGPLPAITTAHRFAGTRSHDIESFAETFAQAGFAVLLHDHRSFGDSGGLPRHDIDPWHQI
ncbi:X-Pro dipeptidyl-peptidase-like protein [Paraburkholderia sp. RAU2J]|uniref:alpha/beta hydrolase n=1 Tax=Paraburkholderia sp. RAU2J TaxID=1938810 RepID=UPI000EAB9897|nr:CocE/NonD family hydrolase [Paraburkholderia sp. RAU2J]RKT14066.1 X-Pro dipeptidyl-peptidase-like protein [Paraburkholderia sp. RAU2J]